MLERAKLGGDPCAYLPPVGQRSGPETGQLHLDGCCSTSKVVGALPAASCGAAHEETKWAITARQSKFAGSQPLSVPARETLALWEAAQAVGWRYAGDMSPRRRVVLSAWPRRVTYAEVRVRPGLAGDAAWELGVDLGLLMCRTGIIAAGSSSSSGDDGPGTAPGASSLPRRSGTAGGAGAVGMQLCAGGTRYCTR